MSQGDAEMMFLNNFPTEDLDQFKILTNFGQLTAETVFKELCKTHVKVHERLLAEFTELFKVYDHDQDGALTLDQAK